MHCWRSRWWLRDRFLWRLECGVESPRLWSTRDQGSNIAWSEKKAKKPFPSVNNVFALRKPTFAFKYHPNLCKKKSSNYGSLQFQAWICMDEIFMTFKDQNLFLNYICFNNQNSRRSSLQISRSIQVSQTAEVVMQQPLKKVWTALSRDIEAWLLSIKANKTRKEFSNHSAYTREKNVVPFTKHRSRTDRNVISILYKFQVLFVHIRWLLPGWLANSEELIAQARQLTNNFTQFYTMNIHIQLQHVQTLIFVLTNI